MRLEWKISADKENSEDSSLEKVKEYSRYTGVRWIIYILSDIDSLFYTYSYTYIYDLTIRSSILLERRAKGSYAAALEGLNNRAYININQL
jgi:hypothetical protein